MASTAGYQVCADGDVSDCFVGSQSRIALAHGLDPGLLHVCESESLFSRTRLAPPASLSPQLVCQRVPNHGCVALWSIQEPLTAFGHTCNAWQYTTASHSVAGLMVSLYHYRPHYKLIQGCLQT